MSYASVQLLSCKKKPSKQSPVYEVAFKCDVELKDAFPALVKKWFDDKPTKFKALEAVPKPSVAVDGPQCIIVGITLTWATNKVSHQLLTDEIIGTLISDGSRLVARRQTIDVSPTSAASVEAISDDDGEDWFVDQ
jgi:hypothetical protein